MTNDRLIQQTQTWLVQHVPNWNQTTYLLAVSGGVDSMVLLHVFLKLREEFAISFHVMHINHQLREASQTEQAFMMQFCEEHHIPLAVRIWQHPPLTSQIEVLARQFRYANFKRYMQEQDIHYLVTAHHKNDQAETFLMRAIDGHRVSRLGGIAPKRNLSQSSLMCLRPFLSQDKDSLYAYAKKHKVPFYEDVTNHDLDYQRNRMRHQILPMLTEENSEAVEHIATTAQELQAMNRFAMLGMENFLRDVITKTDNGVQVDISSWIHLPDREPHLLLQYLFQYSQITALDAFPKKAFDDLVVFLQTTSQGEWTLPGGYRLLKQYDYIHIVHEEDIEKLFSQESRDQSVLLNHWYCFANDQKVGIFDDWPKKLMTSSMNREILSCQLRSLSNGSSNVNEWQWRQRQPGDYIRLTNGHRQKVRRYFINQKWPQVDRENAQFLVHSRGEIALIIIDNEIKYRHPNFKRLGHSTVDDIRIYLVL